MYKIVFACPYRSCYLEGVNVQLQKNVINAKKGKKCWLFEEHTRVDTYPVLGVQEGLSKSGV